MSQWSCRWALGLLVAGGWPAAALDLVVAGKPVATIVVDQVAPPARGDFTPSDTVAANVLVDWVRKITDATLPVATEAPPGQPVIYLGAAARAQGLKLDDLKSPSQEGLRVVVAGQRALLAGQNDTATVKAVCRFLEELGCRYFMDTSYYRGDKALGEVFPRTPTLRAKDLTFAEQPALQYRSLWGSSWYKPALWKVWNGGGGMPMSAGHAWASYVPAKEFFATHPEYFALRGGKRKEGEWLCTSNADVRTLFVTRLLEKAKAAGGAGSFSVSPPDNHEYCECDACRAQDDPTQVVASSGQVSTTKRFLQFYTEIARRVAAECPAVRLNFYCYADYTEPPRAAERLPDSLVAWLAPIRYSRYHRIGSPISPSQQEMQRVTEGWAKVAPHLAYRGYNANLAESTVPFAKLTTWAYDIPWMVERGFIAMDIETFAAWAIMGPHIYQSGRLMYDPKLDNAALMADYYAKFYGPAAAPLLQQYWAEIDRAFQELPSETGCFYALHLVYTPERLQRLQGWLDEATRVAGDGPQHRARVAFTALGLTMAWDYMAFRAALHAADFAKAKELAERMNQRANGDQFAFHNKSVEYIRRFLVPMGEAGERFTRAPSRLLAQLPDRWRMAYEAKQEGEANGWHQPGFDDAAWREVATYSATLNEQRAQEQFTFMWYRTTFAAPAAAPTPGGRQVLLFLDVDGEPANSAVYVNGRKFAFAPNRSKGGVASLARRRPVWAYVTEALKPGPNVVALMLDHRDISENCLGGIVRPVVLCEEAPAPAAAAPAPAAPKP